MLLSWCLLNKCLIIEEELLIAPSIQIDLGKKVCCVLFNKYFN
jgi:hypothetical protein